MSLLGAALGAGASCDSGGSPVLDGGGDGPLPADAAPVDAPPPDAGEQACQDDPDCAGSRRPVCDRERGVCVECLSAQECTARGTTCHAPSGRCVPSCASSCPAELPACAPYTDACVECVGGPDCRTAARPLCDTYLGRCVALPESCEPQPEPPGEASCPAVCTGGCLPGNVCRIDCSGTGACRATAIECPERYSCDVYCQSNGPTDRACSGLSQVYCPGELACSVSWGRAVAICR